MKSEYLKTEGRYKGEAFKPEGGWLTRSKEKGTPAIQIGLRVVEDAEEEGKTIHWMGWLSDGAIENTIDTLVKCFGFNGDLNGLYSGAQTFEGMPVEFTAEAENYKGKERLKVKWLNPPGYTRTTPAIAEDDAKAILATVGKKARAIAMAVRGDAPKPAAKPQQATKASVQDNEADDVPF